MTRMWFLLLSFGLLSSASGLQIDDQYRRKLESVLDILWESFTPEIRNKENVMIFTMQSLTDVHFIYDLMDEEAKNQVVRSIPAFGEDMTKAADDVDLDFTNAFRISELIVKTVLYGTREELKARNLYDIIVDRSMIGRHSHRQRFPYYVQTQQDKDYQVRGELLNRVGLIRANETCIPGYCSVRDIMSTQPPFATVTVSGWNIVSLNMTPVGGIHWIEKVEFAVNETFRPKIDTARVLGEFAFAEFQYPQLTECSGIVISMYHSSNFGVFVVIPTGDDYRCRSSEDLWMNVQKVNLGGLLYKTQKMFVSIPIFKIDANFDLRMKLNGTPFAEAFDQPSSKLFNASALQAADIMFSPKIPEETNIPDISPDTPRFLAERPFYVELFHFSSQLKIIAGLVNSPWCSDNCPEMRQHLVN